MRHRLGVIVLLVIAVGCEKPNQRYEGTWPPHLAVTGNIRVGEFKGHPIMIRDVSELAEDGFTSDQAPEVRPDDIVNSLLNLVVNDILRGRPHEDVTELEERILWLAQCHEDGRKRPRRSLATIRDLIAAEEKYLREVRDRYERGLPLSQEYPRFSPLAQYQHVYPTIQAVDERLAQLKKSPPQAALHYREGKVLYAMILAAQTVCPARRVIPDDNEVRRFIGTLEKEKRTQINTRLGGENERVYQAVLAKARATYCLYQYITTLLDGRQIKIDSDADLVAVKKTLEGGIKRFSCCFANVVSVVPPEKSIR